MNITHFGSNRAAIPRPRRRQAAWRARPGQGRSGTSGLLMMAVLAAALLLLAAASAGYLLTQQDLGPHTAPHPAGHGSMLMPALDLAGDGLLPGYAFAESGTGPFVTTWRTTAADQTITIPVGGSTASYNIDWGDGTVQTGVSGDQTHTYGQPGNHTVSITGGFERISLAGDRANAASLASIDQWGAISWTDMDGAFAGAANMVYRAADAPDLTGVDSTVSMFNGASSFDGNLSSWDVSGVTDMRSMFAGASSFDGDLSAWDVSGVTDMGNMFSGASSFDQDVSGWDVSQVTSMAIMFAGASSFDQDISGWDVGAVTETFAMFDGASSFDQDVSGWDVSSVLYMEYMFNRASSFNQDVSGWDVSSVLYMDNMFSGATLFDQDLGPWYVTLDGHALAAGGAVGTISPQNEYLAGHRPAYAVDPAGPNSDKFEVDADGVLRLRPGLGLEAGEHQVRILAAGVYFGADPATRTVTVTSTEPELASAAYATGDGRLTITFSEPLNGTANHDRLHVREQGRDAGGVRLDGAQAGPASGATLTFVLADAQRSEVAAMSAPQLDVDEDAVFGLSGRGIAGTADRPIDVLHTAAPTADAGADLTAAEGSGVTLEGAATGSDYYAPAYRWTHDRPDLGIAVSGADTLSPSFTAPNVTADTPVSFTLTVTDSLGAAASDTALVTILNDPANDPSDTVVLEPPGPPGPRDIGRITLSSSVPGALEASWEEPSDSPANYRISWARAGESYRGFEDLSGNAYPTEPRHTITGLEEGQPYKVKMRAVYNGASGAWSGDAIITVAGSARGHPTVGAGADQTVAEGSEVFLAGTASGAYPGDVLAYSWTHDRPDLGIALDDAAALSTSFAAPRLYAGNATVTFTLSATDQYNATGSDAAVVTILNDPANDPPVNTAVLEPSGPPGPRDIGRITLSSSAPGALEASWEPPTDGPADYRISWAKVGEPYRGFEDLSGNAFPAEPRHTITGLEEDQPYKVRLLARYDAGPSGAWSGDAIITVVGQVNSPPAVDAGADRTVAEGETVTLAGTATDADPGDVLAYSWTHDRPDLNVTLDDPSALSPSFAAPDVLGATAVEFTLTVTDGRATVSDTVTITIPDGANADLAADAGADLAVGEGSEVTLAGSASGSEYALAYSWTHDRPDLGITLDDPSALSPSFAAPVVYASSTTVTFTLSVTDQYGATASDAAVVTILNDPANDPPVNTAVLEPPSPRDSRDIGRITLVSSVPGVLEASWEPPTEGPAGYRVTWAKVGESYPSFRDPDGNAYPTEPDHTITGLEAGQPYKVQVRATYSGTSGAWSGDAIITVTGSANSPPAVDAGADRTVAEGDTVTLAGTATDADPGDVLAYSWTHDRPDLGITLDDPSAPSPSFAAPDVLGATAVEFTLTVTDGTDTASDTVTITIPDGANAGLAADAGADLAVVEGSEVTLEGSASGSEYALAYSWTHDRPDLGITLDDPAAPSASFAAPRLYAGNATVTFTLSVTDSYGGAASDAAVVTILNDPANDPPVNTAVLEPSGPPGPRDIGRITLVSSVPGVLEASWEPPSEGPADYRISWARAGEPYKGFEDLSGNAFPAEPRHTITGLEEDQPYKVRLLARYDGAPSGDWSGDATVTVTGSAPANRPPAADAGPDQSVAEGDTVTLAGTASDADPGDVLDYTWTHNGTAAIQMSGAGTLSPSFVAPEVDADVTIEFTLTVTDGTSTISDTVTITIADVPPAARDVLDGHSFVTTWRTTAPGEQVSIPVGGSTAAYDIDWGDGTVQTGVSGDRTHAYGQPGNHTISITGGFERISLAGDPANAARLASIDQWGDIPWTTMDRAFMGASNMAYRAADAPDLSGAGSTASMFSGASSFDGDVSGWDVSGIADMSYMFYGASSFDGDVSGWDVSAVTDMSGMFSGASSFDGNVSGWDVSAVTSMPAMFSGASSFDRDVSGWDVSAVTNMNAMFSGASSFDGNVSGWDVSAVTNMNIMFYGASSFDGDVSGWDVSAVTSMSGMFDGASSFDRDVSGWDVSAVTDTSYMFSGASSFDQDISPWNVSAAADMSSMFDGATLFDQDLGPWYVTLDGHTIAASDGAAGTILPQNGYLAGHNPAYTVDPAGPNSDKFEVDADGVLRLRPGLGLEAGEHQVRIRADGADFGADPATGTVTVATAGILPNNPPAVEAGPDQSVTEGETVALAGTATDADPEDVLAYAWTRNGTLAITLDGGDTPTPSFTAPNVDSDVPVEFTLTVTDGLSTTSDTMTVTISDSANSPPAADAGSDQSVAEGSEVTLTGTSSDADPEDTLAYTWTHNGTLAITLDDAAALSTSFTAPNVVSATPVEFTLTVTDGTSTTSDTMTVTISDSANSPPAVDAGADQSVAEGSEVTLTGTSSDADPEDVLAYAWTHNGTLAITLDDAAALSTSFTAPNVVSATPVEFTLTVTDGTSTTSDTMTVTISDSANSPPAADAGSDQSVAEGSEVTLTGTATDADPEDTLDYAWTHNGSSTITLDGGDTLSPSFTAPNVVSDVPVEFTLTVTDGTSTTSDTMTVTISDSANSPPAADAGSDQSVAEGDTVTLAGTATDADPEDTLAYSWTHNGSSTITLDGGDTLSPSFTAPNVVSATPVEFTLTVTDGTSTTSDTMTVTISDSANSPPAADAGSDQSVAEGSEVTLTGTATDADPEDTLVYTWTHNGTLAITLDDAAALSTSFTAPNVVSATPVEFTLTVTDGTSTTSDTMTVTISDSANSPPAADAGSDQSVAEGDTVTLAGTATDADPEDTLVYTWTHNGTLAITLDDAAALSTSFTAPNVVSATPVEFTLTVTDGTSTTSDTMTVTIEDSANSPPAVEAGPDQSVAEGDTVTLAGTATDADPEDTLAYTWTHNGTLAITLDDAAALSPSFTAPNVVSATPVEFTLTVTDGTSTTSDTMTVTISDSANSPPAVDAGADQSVAEGSEVTLTGTSSDADPEDTLVYTWTHNGTLAITLDDAAALSTSFTAPNVVSATPVEFTLTVTDGTSTTSDTMTVTISDSANSPPAADAGSDQSVAEGSEVTLTGTATDADPEDTLDYAWTHNGSSTITLDGGDTLSPSFTAPNVVSATPVEFTLTVTDGTSTTSDTMTVTIEDSANSPPAVEAGPDQSVAEGDTVTLAGTATDADPEDTLAYTWTHNGTLAITLDDAAALSPSFTAPNVVSDVPVEFTLTVTDGTSTTSDTMTVTISDSANSPPAVDAGADQSVAEGSEVTLTGTATDADPEDTLDYAWTHNGTLAITLDDAAALSPSFTAPNVVSDVPVEFTLTVTDGTSTTSDTMTVTISDSANSPPAVDAGADQSVAEGSEVTLTGTATDADPEDTLDYAWTHNGTLAITLDDAAALSPSFTAPNVVSDVPVEFTLTVTDGTSTTSDTMTVTISDSANSPPAVDAGADQSVAEGSEVTLTGTATDADPEDTLDYAWTHNGTLAITLDDAAALSPSFTAPNVVSDTPVEFTLTVTDGTSTISDTMTVTISDSANSPPAVEAGPDQSVAEGDTVTLAGTATDADPEDTLAYSWTHNGSSTITLDGGDTPTPSFTAPNVVSDTPVEFTLTVTDGTSTTSDTMTVTISDSANSPPAADAGSDQSVAEGSEVTLTGTATDADPEDVLAYAWTHNGSSTITLDGGDTPTPSFTAPNVVSATPVEFTLTVTDGTSTTSDTMTVTISDSANSPPAADAGSDQSVAEGSEVTLTGTATDADPEDVLAYAWTHNGTLAITLDGGDTLSPSFTAPNVVSDTPVVFTLTVTDGTSTTSDTMTVTISDSANSPPAADAGSDQSVAEGSEVTLTGTATDADPEDVLAYAWTHNGTLAITLDGGDTLSPSFTAPNVVSATPVEFTLTVTDGTSTTSDTMTVTISDSANSPPAADAGSDQSVAEGSEVTLTGTATDADPEDVLAYAWTHNGTLAITLDGGDTLSPSFTAPNVVSDTPVVFTLTVTDGTSTISDTMTVTISDSANSPPAADAGSDQSVAEGSEVTLTGTATDADPEDVLAYAWTHNGTLAITLDGGDTLSPSFTAPNVVSATPVEFTLTVTDGTSTTSDTMTVTISDSANSPPAADAGSDQSVAEGSEVTLTGTATDADPEDVLAYAWTHNGTLAITLDGGDTLSPSFTAPNVVSDTPVVFTLTVTDGTSTTSDTMTVTISDSANTDPAQARGAPDGSSFVTTWRTTQPGESITIPASGQYTISWGDGQVDTGVSGTRTHSYDVPGTYTVSISDGITRIVLDGHPDAKKLVSIEQWGSARWESMDSAFAWAANMVYRATDVPNLSRVTDMDRMFHRAASFNGDISDWDVSAATTMSAMFRSASSFDQPLNAWDVSSVTDMSDMFAGARSFDQPLNAWDVSSVTDMSAMFVSARSFDQPLNAWDVSSVTDMSRMFHASSFDQDISSWDVSSVTDMSHMFDIADSFDQPLNAWDVSAATTMSGMFLHADSFDQPLNAWDVSSVTDMSAMFAGATSFNGDISSWDVSGVASTAGMFDSAASFNGDISDWDVSAAADMSDMFRGAASFNGDISDWDVSAATTMMRMFAGASSFDQPLNAWDVSAAADLFGMFGRASSFNQDLSAWDVSAAADMSHMFTGASSFDQNLGSWYIVLDGAAARDGDEALTVGHISAQNAFLDGQGPTYGLGPDADSSSFEIENSTLRLKPAPDGHAKSSYTVTITSTGDFGAGNSRTLEVTVPGPPANRQPTADAGPDLAVAEGDTVTLAGTAADADPGDVLVYSWTHNGTLAIQVAGSDTLTPSFTAPPVDSDVPVEFTLTVTDGTAASTDTATVTVSDVPAVSLPPTADAGPDLTVAEGSAVTLSGIAIHAGDRPATYSWSHDSALGIPITGSDTLTPSFTAPNVDSDTAVTFTLSVTDPRNATATDSVIITIADGANSPPTAGAGSDRAVAEGNAVALAGTAYDADPGDTLAYTWTHDSALGIPITGSDTLAPSFVAPLVDADTPVTFTLSVTDTRNATATATVIITITDIPPSSVPGSPRGLSVSPAASGTLDVSWQPPPSDGGERITGYTVQWKEGAGSWDAPADIGQATVTGTAHSITGLADGTPYAVRVIAINAVGSGEPSPEAAATPRDPRHVGGITLSSTQPGTILASWDAPAEAPRDYRVSWAKAGDPYLTWTDLTGNAFPTEPSWTITGLEEDEEYKVKVRARYDGGGGPGDWSVEATIRVAGSGQG